MFVDSFPLDSSSFIIYVSLRDIIVSYAIRYTNWLAIRVITSLLFRLIPSIAIDVLGNS